MTTSANRRDTDLKQAVVDELTWDPSIDSTDIGVSVSDGSVTLSGEVSAYQQKLAAATIAQHVRGVTAIAEEIVVRSADLTALNDSDVARNASAVLEQAVNVPATIKASVQDHVITLSGEGWHFQRQAAERAVRYLVGVRDVVDNIGLRTSPPALASSITSSIHEAFSRSAVTDRSHVSVTCGPNGAVTLDGTVRSWDERRQCEDAAWAAPGVRRVIDNLQVSL